jgi:hypothetical protein
MFDTQVKPKDLNDFIAAELNNPGYKARFAAKIVDAAAEADPTALKQVLAALEELKYKQDEKLKLSDEQIRQIIILTADRIRSNKET